MKQLPLNTVIQGDVREVLKTFPDESVHCVITSPPYFGLRDYGTEPLIWGGEKGCEHVWGDETVRKQTGGTKNSTLGELSGGHKISPEHRELSIKTSMYEASQGQFCQLCGAWRGSLGLEPTPELYVEHIVEICRELKRVLRKDGTFWLNLGDSYASGKGTCFNPGGGTQSLGQNKKEMGAHPLDRGNISTLRESGLKPKDLCGMPWRVAFALQADGWWLRSDIIWAKPNPMPESVTDRPTRSHEYVFLLSKSKSYYYDQDAIKEPLMESSLKRISQPNFKNQTGGEKDYRKTGINPNRSARQALENLANNPTGRNRRSVWTIATQSYPEAHFATFPEALIRPMILAGTSEYGCCSKCGAPWERVVEKESYITRPTTGRDTQKQKQKPECSAGLARTGGHVAVDSKTIGWKPTCECNAAIGPCIVLDPFIGSGTVALASLKLGRDYIGIDLKQEYIEMSKERVKKYNEQTRLL